jgi:hypothetical protein
MIWRLKKIAKRKFKETEKNNDPIDFSINSQELKEIQFIYRSTMLISGSIGALIILIYYIPIHGAPDFFNYWILKINLFGYKFDFALLPALYNILLLIIELSILGIIHIYAVRKLIILTQFPDPKSNDYSFHFSEMIDLTLGNTKSSEKLLGLNPYYGLPKFYIAGIFIFNMTKAFLSNVIIKSVFNKLLGRYILRIYTDLLGMPVFFFWNAYATRSIYMKAKYYIFGQRMVYFCVQHFGNKYKDNLLFKDQIYEILSQISIHKRSFNKTHYFYSNKLFKQFEIDVISDFKPNYTFKSIINELSEEMAQDVITLFVVGIVIDGDINRREKNTLNFITSEANYNIPAVDKHKELLKAFRRGDGLDFLQNLIHDKDK